MPTQQQNTLGEWGDLVVLGATGGSISNGQATVSGPVTLRAVSPSRRSIIIQNLGSGTLYVGGYGTTTGSGVKIASGGQLVMDRSVGGAIYADASGTCDVRFLEELS